MDSISSGSNSSIIAGGSGDDDVDGTLYDTRPVAQRVACGVAVCDTLATTATTTADGVEMWSVRCW